jgi:hypothetical protein
MGVVSAVDVIFTTDKVSATIVSIRKVLIETDMMFAVDT